MLINDSFYGVEYGFTPVIRPALVWNKLSNGKYSASDRGDLQDIHETEITVYGVKQNIISLSGELDNTRESFEILFNSGEQVFGPHIDYTTALTVVCIDHGEIKVLGTEMSEIQLKLRLLNHTSKYISTVVTAANYLRDSINSLKHVNFEVEADKTWTINYLNSYGNLFFYVDHNADKGFLNLSLREYAPNNFSSAIIGPMIKNILTVTRGSAFQLLPGFDFDLFGIRTGTTYNVKLMEFKLKNKKDLITWDMDMKIVEDSIT